jgi:hypothetical protein
MPWFTHRAFKRKLTLSLRSALLLAGIGMLLLSSSALAYNFTYFGGRQGRPGVDPADLMYSWNRAATGGTLTWFLVRGELSLSQCNAACFQTLHDLAAPELAKWALWIDLAFAEAPDSASADVIIRFTTATSAADAQAWRWVGNTLTRCLIRINPNYQNWSTPGGRAGFSFTILHEWGHCLGVGDLYMIDHGYGHTFEGEDFCDHGLPSGPLPDPRVKEDNVMETYGVTVLDNDEIYVAEWLWGNSGSDAITTGALQTRIAGENANEAASHHGPITWTYRGTVWGPSSPTIVRVYFNNIHAARSIGWGSWTVQIFPTYVEWTTGAYRGNFIFQIDDCQSESERLGNATAATTSFTATPAGGGRQVFPFPQIFGADCLPCPFDISVTTQPPGVPVTVGPVSTCGAGDDCNLRTGEDYLIQLVVDSAWEYTFSLCDATGWNTYVYLAAVCCCGNVIVADDDGCGVTGGASVITCQHLEPGTYYLDIEPYTSGQCGDFTLTIFACSTATDTTVHADSVTVRLVNANTNVEIHFRAPVAGEYTVWSTTNKNAVFPTNFIPEVTITASPGLNMWTDPSAIVAYKLYTVTHTYPSRASNRPVHRPIDRPFEVKEPSAPGTGSRLNR